MVPFDLADQKRGAFFEWESEFAVRGPKPRWPFQVDPCASFAAAVSSAGSALLCFAFWIACALGFVVVVVFALALGAHVCDLRKPEDDDDNKSHCTRDQKRKAKDGGAGGRTGSGEGGAWIELKGPGGFWTPHGKLNFPLEKGAPFLVSEVKWDQS